MRAVVPGVVVSGGARSLGLLYHQGPRPACAQRHPHMASDATVGGAHRTSPPAPRCRRRRSQGAGVHGRGFRIGRTVEVTADAPTLFTDALELAAAARANVEGPSHRGDPETSRLAAAANRVRSGSQRARVLGVLAASENGRTDDEVAEALGHPYPHVLGTRRGELQTLGLVEPVEGERRRTRLDCLAQVYGLTDLGRDVAREVR